MAQSPPPPGAAKLYLVYDQYGLRQPDDTHLVFVDLGVSVDDFKLNNQMLYAMNKFSVDGDLVPFLAGETGSKTYFVASEISKKFSKSLLKKLKEDCGRWWIRDKQEVLKISLEEVKEDCRRWWVH